MTTATLEQLQTLLTRAWAERSTTSGWYQSARYQTVPETCGTEHVTHQPPLVSLLHTTTCDYPPQPRITINTGDYRLGDGHSQQQRITECALTSGWSSIQWTLAACPRACSRPAPGNCTHSTTQLSIIIIIIRDNVASKGANVREVVQATKGCRQSTDQITIGQLQVAADTECHRTRAVRPSNILASRLMCPHSIKHPIQVVP